MRLIRGIVGLCVAIGLCASTSQAELIKDGGLILDTTTGIRWVPVNHVEGARAIEDLEPGQRYATYNEVSTLLNTYVRPLSCDFSGGFVCTPSGYQALTDFIHIFRAEEDPIPISLLAVFAPEGTPEAGMASFLTLFAGEEMSAFFDIQGTHYPPIQGDFGMFLVSTVSEPSTFVNIDIKPGGLPNTLNPKSNGVIAVAILTTPDFNTATVDPLSVEFGPEGPLEAHGKGHIEDVNGDGHPDLLLHFRTQETGIECGDTSASLTGATFQGEQIQGVDAITTVGCKKP
jgi:hypothetical protein